MAAALGRTHAQQVDARRYVVQDFECGGGGGCASNERAGAIEQVQIQIGELGVIVRDREDDRGGLVDRDPIEIVNAKRERRGEIRAGIAHSGTARDGIAGGDRLRARGRVVVAGRVVGDLDLVRWGHGNRAFDGQRHHVATTAARTSARPRCRPGLCRRAAGWGSRVSSVTASSAGDKHRNEKQRESVPEPHAHRHYSFVARYGQACCSRVSVRAGE